MLYSLMSGLALARLIPGYEPALAEGVLGAFKALVRAALPEPALPEPDTPDGGNHHGNH